MKVKEALEKLQQMDPEADLVIPIVRKHPTIGASPSADIKSVSAGFDWDSGKVFLNPEITGHLVHDDDGEITKATRKLSNLVAWLFAHENGEISAEDMVKHVQNTTAFKQLLRMRNERSS